MAEKIEKDGRLYAIIHRSSEWREGLDFITPPDMVCQVGTWQYQKNKKLKPHRHIPNKRINELTQECVIMISGGIYVGLYDGDNRLFYGTLLSTGDLVIMVEGGHSYEILEDNTKVIECKNGPFISVEKDKQAI